MHYLFIGKLDVVGLWFDHFTTIDRILVPDIENISSDLLHVGMWLFHFSSTVTIFQINVDITSKSGDCILTLNWSLKEKQDFNLIIDNDGDIIVPLHKVL